VIKRPFKEFIEELKNKKFEPLPSNVMGSDDFEEKLREEYQEIIHSSLGIPKQLIETNESSSVKSAKLQMEIFEDKINKIIKS
jgi:hypothetical protein